MGTNSTTPELSLSTGHWIVDGTGWSFQAILYDTTSLTHKNIIFDPAHIKLFEYTNQWNSLVLTGQLVYKDTERNLGKLFRVPHLIMSVEWAENEAQKKEFPKKDHGNGPEESGDYWVEKPIKKEDYFYHTFLVNKMEIIEHDTSTDVITYRFELVSAWWYKLSSTCQYSNYNLKKPEPITDIICKLLIDAVGIDNVGTKTFLEDPCKTDICIYYTSTQQDNYFTAINYLLNRMYMEPSSFDVDNHPRIILWDEKERKYRMAKINDDSTCLRVKNNQIQLNRLYEISDFEVNPYAPGEGGASDIKPTVTSLSKMTYTRFVKGYFTRQFWDLNITKDKFVRRTILSDKVSNLFKSPSACPKKDTAFQPTPNMTSEKDVPDLQSFLVEDKLKYIVSESKWNNQRHLYNDCINSLTNRDTFTLTRQNKVCHQPWQCFYMLKDKEHRGKKYLDTDNMKVDKVDSDQRKTIEPKTEENKGQDNQFLGPWYTYKTTHIIMIANSGKQGVPTMIEKLQLIKPFEIAPVPNEIKK